MTGTYLCLFFGLGGHGAADPLQQARQEPAHRPSARQGAARPLPGISIVTEFYLVCFFFGRHRVSLFSSSFSVSGPRLVELPAELCHHLRQDGLPARRRGAAAAAAATTGGRSGRQTAAAPRPAHGIERRRGKTKRGRSEAALTTTVVASPFSFGFFFFPAAGGVAGGGAGRSFDGGQRSTVGLSQNGRRRRRRRRRRCGLAVGAIGCRLLAVPARRPAAALRTGAAAAADDDDDVDVDDCSVALGRVRRQLAVLKQRRKELEKPQHTSLH